MHMFGVSCFRDSLKREQEPSSIRKLNEELVTNNGVRRMLTLVFEVACQPIISSTLILTADWSISLLYWTTLGSDYTEMAATVSTQPLEIVFFWRLKHYLHIIVCQHGV